MEEQNPKEQEFFDLLYSFQRSVPETDVPVEYIYSDVDISKLLTLAQEIYPDWKYFHETIRECLRTKMVADFWLTEIIKAANRD
jgi:hypothetical protein